MEETNVEEITPLKYIYKILSLVISILMLILTIYILRVKLFQDENILANNISKMGILAPFIFIILQIIQVIIPIIPGSISCLAGVLAFGPILGFIYNYIGLVIGSCIVYYISKKYGVKLINNIFDSHKISKYLKYKNSIYFKRIFFLSIILPGFPDDLLCYVAGISSLTFRSFITTILIGKPISLLMYSIFVKIL